ncbi:MAG TPA: hypothetical protein VK604_24245 [Bryobacteraceae bacterium]|nr:hypothetical protein [Bryobacteraceae bacterium]
MLHGTYQMPPHLLLHPVFDHGEAPARIANPKAVHPWQHVNLFGIIEFSRALSPVDLDALAARYADPARWRKAFEEELGAALA